MISYITCPSIGWMKVEQHPMSIASMPSGGPEGNQAVFLIKAEQGAFPVRMGLLRCNA
jgi:hypothetical protein